MPMAAHPASFSASFPENGTLSDHVSVGAPVSSGRTPLPAPPSKAPGASKRALLLEDDSAFREIIKEFFQEAGYTVREVNSGVEGIQEVLAGDFSIVLCDMMMPGLAGDLFYRAVER